MLSNSTIPPVETTVSIVEIDGMTVVVVAVNKARTVMGTTGGLYVRRALRVDGAPQCVPYAAHEMLASEIDRGAIDYAAIAEPKASMTDLDPLEFERFRSLVVRSGTDADFRLADLPDEEILRTLGVAKTVGDRLQLARGALLLFGRPQSIEAFVPTHEVAFQVLKGDKVETNESNRDYTRIGPVRVQLTCDGLEITSSGSFPSGVTLDHLLNSSQPRSPLLANAFKRAGLVERTGRGINRIYDSLLRIGREAPDYSRSTDYNVTVVLPISAADLPLVRFMLDHEESTGQRFRLADIQILHELRREPRMPIPEIAQVLQTTATETRTILGRMLEGGVVEQRGNGRARRYMLTSAVYRALESPSAYVRVHPFDHIQQEQMVLKYIGAQRSITRQQAADLCGLAPSQAGMLLQRMRASGAIVLRGEKRGSHYVLTP